MSVVIIDGRVRVSWLTACANTSGPTVAELNAGTALQGFITPDGLNIGMETGGVNTSNLGSTFTTMRAGRKVPSITVKMHHDSPTDSPYNLVPYRANGFLAIRRGVDATTAWATSDKVEIYPVESGEAQQEPPQPDGTWDFTSPMFVTSDPVTRAVVA